MIKAFTHNTYSLRVCIMVICTIMMNLSVFAQNDFEQNEVRHSYLFGYGYGNVLDSYLSPYSYTGSNFKFIFESTSESSLSKKMGCEVLYHSLLTADGSILSNHPQNVNEYAGGVRWDIGLLRHLYTNGAFKLFAGPTFDAYIGGVYNERNGNNPAQLKLNAGFDVKAMAMYDFTLWKKAMHVEYIASLPLVGIAHTPEYGESYYEMYGLKSSNAGIKFAHPFNMPSLRHLLTLEMPIVKGHNIRIGYSGDFMQSKMNGIKYHSYTQTIMIGVTSSLFRKAK